MNAVFKLVQSLTRFTKWIALAIMGFMMLFITTAVIGRAFGHPILGDVELVQIAMVVLIMFGLAYSQAKDSHVAIGLLVDRLSPRVQGILDVFGFVLTMVICITIGWVYIGVGLKNMLGSVLTTDLVGIPYYPFNFIIAIGFFLWGLEALLRIIKSLIMLTKGEFVESKGEESEQWL